MRQERVDQLKMQVAQLDAEATERKLRAAEARICQSLDPKQNGGLYASMVLLGTSRASLCTCSM